MAARHLERLTLYDFSDMEFLHVLLDLATADGWVTTTELAEALRLDVKHPNQNVGVRLGWLKRLGVVERDEEPHSETRWAWRLTEEGQAVMDARLRKREENLLEGLAPEMMVEITNYLTARYHRVGEATANLIRRQWLNGTHLKR